MSKDKWHHVEGTLVAQGVFRVYFYNEFTKPVPPGVFSARVAVTDSNNKEIGPPIPLTVSKTKDGNTMDAHIPNLPVPTKAAQVYVKLRVKFKPTDADWVTDYQFPEYSKEPVVLAQARPPAPTPKPPQTAKPPVAKPTVAKPPAPAPTATVSGGAMAGSSAPDLSGAGFAAQAVLPDTTPELLALLKTKSDDVQKGLQEGQLGGVWLPALDGKDIGIALEENHINELSDSQRPKLTSAVKQLTVTAWQIDAAGDLGNAEKLRDLYNVFAAAVAEIRTLYAPAP